MKPNAREYQTHRNAMKSTKYLTTLRTVFLIIPAALLFSNPTIVHAEDNKRLSVGFIRPRHVEYRGELLYGYLTVYSATDRSEDGGLEYYAHSSYAIYTVDGKLLKRVENHMSPTDEAPEIVSLPTGSYIVEARSERDGYIREPVTINDGRRTILNLDRN